MSNIDSAVKRGMYGSEFAKGRRAAKAGKSRFDCPYNGADLRDGWFAGFDSVRLEAARAKAADRRIDGYNPEFLGAKPARAGQDY